MEQTWRVWFVNIEGHGLCLFAAAAQTNGRATSMRGVGELPNYVLEYFQARRVDELVAPVEDSFGDLLARPDVVWGNVGGGAVAAWGTVVLTVPAGVHRLQRGKRVRVPHDRA